MGGDECLAEREATVVRRHQVMREGPQARPLEGVDATLREQCILEHSPGQGDDVDPRLRPHSLGDGDDGDDDRLVEREGDRGDVDSCTQVVHDARPRRAAGR